MRRAAARMGTVMLAVVAAGCVTNPNDAYFRKTDTDANVYVARKAAPVSKVAIMPFKAPTELIGASVSDMFVTEMLRAGRYELVERSQLAQVLGESELALAGLSASAAVEVGNMVGADGVIIGTVDEYGMVAQRGRTYPAVGVSARMIHCGSGKVIWSVDLARRSRERGSTLSRHARTLVHEMTAALYKQWRR